MSREFFLTKGMLNDVRQIVCDVLPRMDREKESRQSDSLTVQEHQAMSDVVELAENHIRPLLEAIDAKAEKGVHCVSQHGCFTE